MKFSTVPLILLVLTFVKGQNESRRCGLPENISQFPDFVQDEIKAVWKNYVPGTKCDKELLITDDILAVLNMFETEVPGGLSGISTEPQTTRTSTVTEVFTTPTTTRTETTASTSESFLPLVSQTFFATSLAPPVTPNDAHIDRSFSTMPDNNPEQFKKIIHVETDYIDPQPNPIKNFIQSEFPDGDYDDDNIETIPFFEIKSRLPFLEGASKKVVRAFYRLMNNPDMPSERRRQELIHVLAVSYLNADQLKQFNAWSTLRRKRIMTRERQLRSLSLRARDTLRQLALMDEPNRKITVQKLPPHLRQELRNHARKLIAQKQAS